MERESQRARQREREEGERGIKEGTVRLRKGEGEGWREGECKGDEEIGCESLLISV